MSNRNTSRWILAVAFLLVPFAARAGEFDWPQWQGSDRDAVSKETGLLREWPEGGPELAWRISGLGGGYSAPAVVGGRLYGISNQDEDEVVWARSEKDGSVIWTKRIAAKTTGGMRQGIEGAGCTPTVEGDRLYVIGAGGTIACMTTDEGEIVWQKNFVTDLGGELPTWRYNESPLLDGDKVICTPGGKSATLVALNKANGEVLWRSVVPEQGLTAPASGPGTDGAANPSGEGTTPKGIVLPPPTRRPSPAPDNNGAGTRADTGPGIPDKAGADSNPLSLVAAGSEWKYFDKGISPANGWTGAAFDDAAWATGKAQLGYGDRDEATRISDARDAYPTYYFRLKFQADAPENLKPLVLRILRDDGAIVHLNGKEIVRDNMPLGDVVHGTFAASVTPSESGFYVHDLAASSLSKGENILAVEVHQASANSSDVSFDLELREKTGTDVAGAPPAETGRFGGGGRRGFGGGGQGAGRSGAAYSSPIAIEFGGVRQYVQLTAQSLVGVSAEDGKLLWRYDRPANRMGINCSTPLYLGDGKVFAASAYGAGGGMAQLRKNDAGGFDADEVWFSGDMENHHGGTVVIDGSLYGANGGNGGGYLACLDVETGEVLWDERDGDRRAKKGSIAFADGRIYYRTEDGDVLLIEPNRDGFIEHGRIEQPDRTREPAWTHPVIAKGKLYIRDQDTLFCYDIKAAR